MEAKKQNGGGDDGNRTSWKLQTATALLGEYRALNLAASVDDMRAGRVGVGVWRKRTLTSQGRTNSAYIRQFKNIHAGERCVIIGNGPSLKQTDLRQLRGEFTFGLNRIYLMFDELGFETNYHVVVNQLVVKQCSGDFRRIKSPLFTTTSSHAFLGNAPETAYLRSLAGPRFFGDVRSGVWEGGTVTYVAMQLAYYMGFTKVILVGVDHRFAVTGPPNLVVESAGPDASHFDPNYFGKGFKWQLPDLETSELAYELARTKFETTGRRIIDGTVGGALTVFPKMTLEQALRR